MHVYIIIMFVCAHTCCASKCYVYTSGCMHVYGFAWIITFIFTYAILELTV